MRITNLIQDPITESKLITGNEDPEIGLSLNSDNSISLKENLILAYIAGFISLKITSKIKCALCKSALFSNKENRIPTEILQLLLLKSFKLVIRTE